jgi:hypothetical protein
MITASSRWLSAAGLLAAALSALLAVGACSVSDSPMSGGDSAAAPGAPQFDAEKGDRGAPEQPAPAPTGAPDVDVTERSLIYTGSVIVKTDDVVKAADDAIALAVAQGGIVGADRRQLNQDRSSTILIFRVPSAKFAATLDALAKLGAEQSRQVQADDVTEAIIDLDARLKNQQASVDRIRTLLAQAKTTAEVISIEAELSRRVAELDSFTQRRSKLAGLVSMSTITLNLRGPAAPQAEDEEKTGFVAGLESGWDAFLASVKIVMTVLGFLLPWFLAIGVPLWLLIWLLRRGHRNPPPTRLVPPTPATPSTPSTPATPSTPPPPTTPTSS